MYIKVLTILREIKKWAFGHKIFSTVILVIIIFAGYRIISGTGTQTAEAKYILKNVERGTIITSVTGTGQISALNQVELTSKVEGDIIYLNAKAGTHVDENTKIAQIDATDAIYELENARLSYKKLVSVDEDDLRRAENTVTQAKEDLDKAYLTAFSSLGSSFNELSDVLSGLDDIFSNSGFLRPNAHLSRTAQNYRDIAEESWDKAGNAVDSFSNTYKTISAGVENKTIGIAIDEAYNSASLVVQATKDTEDAILYIKEHNADNSTAAENAYTSVSSLSSSANSLLSTLNSARNGIKSSQRSLDDASSDLNNLKDGPDELDRRSEELTVKQKEEAVSNYSIRSPLSGTIASVDIQKGDTVQNGTKIATVITDKKIAEISLNEVDAAKVSNGQKATLTFDAIEDITITGTVSEVNLIGTVSQGVVSYTVKIALDTESELIRPGMTVSASIITDSKQDTLTAPLSAVKTLEDGTSYVEVFSKIYSDIEASQGIVSDVEPEKKQVEIGISNETTVEILSGLNEGDQIVYKKTSDTSSSGSTTKNSTQSIFGGGGIPGGMR